MKSSVKAKQHFTWTKLVKGFFGSIVIFALLMSSSIASAKRVHHKHRHHRHRHHAAVSAKRTSGSVQQGIASWYGPGFHRHKTASGERYNMYAMTAASLTLPLNSYTRVTNLRNGKQIIVKINDRGPYVHPRIMDLSYAAAKKLGMVERGTALVRIELIKPVAA